MRNFLFIALLALSAFGCDHSVNADSPSEKQPVINADADSRNSDEDFVLISKITCPKCGHTAKEQMPTEVCQIAYTCKKCKTTMHPQGDDCCVFCTYGDHKCPSKQ